MQDQDEFGNITKDEYLKMAQNLVDHPGKSVLTKKDSDGNTLYYDKDNNTFAVKSPDGYIRTFFKPQAGIDYYDRQTWIQKSTLFLWKRGKSDLYLTDMSSYVKIIDSGGQEGLRRVSDY